MNKHAVVIGASMAGLSTARVLASRYERVTVLDRDTLPPNATARRGVPQGNHGHILLLSGLRALERLFPGLRSELLDRGATTFDMGRDLITYRFGRRWPAIHADLDLVSVGRPLLESVIRDRVAAEDTVTFHENVTVTGLLAEDDRVTGVMLGTGETMTADLVVDCSGRGARSDHWLVGRGFPVPEQLEIKVGVGYATRLYTRSPGQLEGRSGALVLPDPRKERFSGLILPIEGDRWLVGLASWHIDTMPQAPADFERIARSLPDPALRDLLDQTSPLTEPTTFRFPSSRRRLFEDLDRIPAGFVTVGDALCSFNPIYGQGMTCAALEAVALGETLDRHGSADTAMARDYYAAAAGVVGVPWQFGAGGDFAYPQTTGARPRGVTFTNWFARVVSKASQVDPVLDRRFSAVQQLVAPPQTLQHPSFLARVLIAMIRRAFERAPRA